MKKCFLNHARLSMVLLLSLFASSCSFLSVNDVGTGPEEKFSSTDSFDNSSGQTIPLEAGDMPYAPYMKVEWNEVPGWKQGADQQLSLGLFAFRRSCRVIGQESIWYDACRQVAAINLRASQAQIRGWIEKNFVAWQLVDLQKNTVQGKLTGYYEPVLRGSLYRSSQYQTPVMSPPDDLVRVELSRLYPELKGVRVRGRLDGNRLVPYWTRQEWETKKYQYPGNVILWLGDAASLFFLQTQGSGMILLDDGSKVRVGYADQNGYPFRSIAVAAVEMGAVSSVDQASNRRITDWVRANPRRGQELLNQNPSVVFFRTLSAGGSGPIGSLGVPLIPQRSLAVDNDILPMGAMVWIDTMDPSKGSRSVLRRLMSAQDTGGVIKGAVRGDLFWGTGDKAGDIAQKTNQAFSMWVLLPNGVTPNFKK